MAIKQHSCWQFSVTLVRTATLLGIFLFTAIKPLLSPYNDEARRKFITANENSKHFVKGSSGYAR